VKLAQFAPIWLKKATIPNSYKYSCIFIGKWGKMIGLVPKYAKTSFSKQEFDWLV
jgi:hypothetical protein